MVDSLNAEISLGNVSNVRDGIQWLGYTYLFVRMRMNPFAYGQSLPSGFDGSLSYPKASRENLSSMTLNWGGNAWNWSHQQLKSSSLRE